MDEFLTVKETASILKICRATIYLWKRKKVPFIPSYKIGGKIVYKKNDLINFIEKMKMK